MLCILTLNMNEKQWHDWWMTHLPLSQAWSSEVGSKGAVQKVRRNTSLTLTPNRQDLCTKHPLALPSCRCRSLMMHAKRPGLVKRQLLCLTKKARMGINYSGGKWLSLSFGINPADCQTLASPQRHRFIRLMQD